MKAIEFKKYIEEYLGSVARLHGIKNLERYYENTDLLISEINQLENNSIQQTFAQFILHAQNARYINNIVKFTENYEFLKEITRQFSPKDFLNRFEYESENDREESVNSIVEALRYDENTNPNGLRWNNREGNRRDIIVKRFANSLIDGAVYLENFQDKQAVIEDLKIHYDSVRNLISYTEGEFRHGFSVALCCDFLKELSPTFDLPKPDVHIMETLAKYMGHNRNYYKNSQNRAYECINDFLKLVEKIKEIDPHMTAYKLDRQIWLCCTGIFFLDTTFNIKRSFLNGIN